MSAFGEERLLADYARQFAAGRADAARQVLCNALADAPEAAWLACARALTLRSDLPGAQAVLEEASRRHPSSFDIALALAGITLQAGRHAEAERILATLLQDDPGHAGAAFLLFQVLQEQGRLQAAGTVLTRLFSHRAPDAETAIQAIEWLDAIQRPADALYVCERTLDAGLPDPRLHAYAGMLCLQLGRFDQVRQHYRFVLAHSDRAGEWNVPAGLAGLQRYVDDSHPDFTLFRQILARPDLGEAEREGTLFALAKACDDIGDYAGASQCLREANALAQARTTWSRKQWRRRVEARLSASPRRLRHYVDTTWAPLFIVGVPRSGTTLLADRLARLPHIRQRGELGGIAQLASQLDHGPRDRPELFEQAVARYATHLRQDDAPARWYIDKQPLNLLHVDLMLALWPGARVLYCQRNARDTAVSLWSQSFHDPAHGYACDMQDIAAVIQGCRKLAALWSHRFGEAFRTVHYEDLVDDPDSCLAGLAAWLDVPAREGAAEPDQAAIRTASYWQARQPVYRHAVARWRHYAAYLPELLRIPDN